MTKPKLEARLEILNYVIGLATKRSYDGQLLAIDPKNCFSHREPKPGALPGDLVCVNVARTTKWYLSWVHETELLEDGDCRYALESIEDGEVANWTNVSVSRFDPEAVSRHPSWRWTDKQHELNQQWFEVCRDADAYIVRPLEAVFDGDSVTLGTRTRFDFDDIRPTRQFDNWRKVNKAMMLAFYLDAVAERDRLLAERKAATRAE